MRRLQRTVVGLAVTLVASGCGLLAKDEPDISSVVASPVPHPPNTYLVPGHTALGLDRPEEESQGDVDFAALKPPSWTLLPPKPMRIASFQVPRAPGDPEDGDVSLSRVGGDVESNIKRWIGQFQGEPKQKREEKSFGSIHFTHVEINGTYAPGGGMDGSPAPEPRPGTTMLGEIVELPGSSFFVKFVGPDATVNAARPDFNGFLSNLLLKIVGRGQPAPV
jgi:hypothetical protein